ncbi:MAG TPA: OmpA family protein, partial [Candidatus Goldiibacteriota bacterium]|nr:OmpA family protein [Candidatus Goldiibacteriota bacterium]
MRLKNSLIAIIAVFIVFFSLFYSTGCRKKRVVAVPTPTPTNTPVPSMEKIVYTYNGVMFWMNTDGSGKEMLFGSANSKWYPKAAPDGWRIIFWAQSGGYYNLWHADLKTRKASQITFDEDLLEGDIQNFRISNAVSWSQDSSFVVYSRNRDIWKVTKEGLNPEALTDTHDCISPTLSKNNRILYARINSALAHNLYEKDMYTMNETKLTSYTDRMAGSPVYSPDGNFVLYTLSDAENVDIYILDVRNKKEEQLTFDGKSHSPEFSKDGSKIIYSSNISDKYQPDIWIMNRDKSEKTKLTKDGGVSPSWLFRILSEPMPTFTPVFEQPARQEQAFIEKPLDGQVAEEQPVQEAFTPPASTPEELSVKLVKQGNKLMFYPVIYFDVGVANIKQEFFGVLDDMTVIIQKYSSPVVIEGHTDNSPINTKRFPNNKVLSVARGNAVKKYLISKGVAASRLSVSGFGEERPIAPNDTAENKYRNRRAEIHIAIIAAEEQMAEAQVAVPTVEPTPTAEPAPEPTATPVPKKKNFIEKLF